MIRVRVSAGLRKGAEGSLIRQFKSVVHGKEVDHLKNREVILDGEKTSRVYAAHNIELL
jgi:hypothetical protein